MFYENTVLSVYKKRYQLRALDNTDLILTDGAFLASNQRGDGSRQTALRNIYEP